MIYVEGLSDVTVNFSTRTDIKPDLRMMLQGIQKEPHKNLFLKTRFQIEKTVCPEGAC